MEKYLLVKRKIENSTEKITNEHETKKKTLNSNSPSQSLVNKWCSLYRWLDVHWMDNIPYFKCKLCVSAKKSNILSTTTGSCILKVDTLKKHELSVEHKHAVQETCLTKSQTWEKSVAVSVSRAEEHIISSLKIIYLQAKENIAIRKFSSLKKLCIDLGCSSFSSLSNCATNYESYDSIHDMEKALAMTIHAKIIDKVNNARWFSVIIDECTDVSVDQCLIIYLKLLHKGKMYTHYLSLVQMEAANARYIYSCVIDTLEKMNINVAKCSAIGTDGPSVMTGVRAGVAALFKNRNPHLISVHCVAHRLALAASQAASENAYLVKYQDILKRIHAYFEYSPTNTRRLKDVQDVYQQTSKKCVKISATRWLSLGNSVSSLDCNWQALVTVFMEDKRPVAKGLLKNITSYLFLATTAVINDVMFCINKLSLVFQKSNLDFECVQLCVTACLENLEAMKNRTGTHLLNFIDAVPKEVTDKFEYQGHIISDGMKQRESFNNLMSVFLNSIIRNINERLGDLNQVAMFNIFLPRNIPKISAELQEYGQTEIESIFTLFSANPLLKEFNKMDMLAEWAVFKRILQQRCINMNFQELLEFLHVNYMFEQYPAMCSIIEYCATIPMHTVDCERGFSRLNLIKTDNRNRLSVENVNNLLMINLEGPERNNFDFNDAFKKWASMKERMILTCKPKSFEK